MIRLRALVWQDWTALTLWLLLAVIFTPYSIAHTGWWIPSMQITGGILAAAILPITPVFLLWLVLKSE
jgi:hypothetical protein